MSDIEPIDSAKIPQVSMQGRVLGDPRWNTICLKVIGRALDGGSVSIDGKLTNPNVPSVDIQNAIDTIHENFVNDRVRAEIANGFRVLFVYPTKALTQLPQQLRRIAEAYGKNRESEDLSLNPEPEWVDAATYGRVLQQNAELVVTEPESIDPVARKVLSAEVEGVPEVGCADGPWLPYIVRRIHQRVGTPLRGRAFWKFVLLLQGTLTFFTLFFALLGRQDGALATAAVLLAFLGCGFNGYLQENLLHGYDRYILASAKTWAKVPGVLALISALLTSLIFQGELSVLALIVALLSSLLLAVSGLCADCLVNHADAATK